MTDFRGLIQALHDARVEFIVVGGAASDLEAIAELEVIREERGDTARRRKD